MISLAERVRRDEQMDEPELDPVVYRAVLHDLARVNRWTLAARPTLGFLRNATRRGDSFRLLDVGFGHGDMLRRIARWAEARGIEAELVGVDLNPKSLEIAQETTPPELGIRLEAGDYRDVDGPFDFIVSSLVAHHMEDPELVSFIRFMERRARRGWFVNDLHRHRAAHLGYPLLARGLGTHRIVREDGTLSIARSFRRADWTALLRNADLPEGAARITRRFPLRLCVERLF